MKKHQPKTGEETQLPDRRLVIVSNRLPFSVMQEGEKIAFHESAGGLVTGLSSFLASLGQEGSAAARHLWIGWPGGTVDPSLHAAVKTEALQQYNCFPVFLSQEDMDQFYLGFCNRTIWPLFHYFPTITEFQEAMWQQYVKVNESFSDAVLEVVHENDLVWVHDYHLMLLPRLLKQKAPSLQVGFFLHIPFPSFEVFRLLPGVWRRDILEGLSGADLLGFHTYEYTQHFLQCVLRILGHEHTMGQIMTSDRMVKVETFPMGIHYERFHEAAVSPKVQDEARNLRETLKTSRVILSVDRLDYTKGILHRLQAFEILLERHPELAGEVVLLMVVVPSRIGVDQYELMKKQIEESVGGINGRFGSVNWTPVIYQYRHVPFESLVALYAVSDVCLVTPLRDGMNLVAKEYVASRDEAGGVLILSEMAGAAKELGEAIIINPNNREEIAAAMKQALEMPADEQRQNIQLMQNRIRRYNVTRWARDFVRELIATADAQAVFCAKLLPAAVRHSMIKEYAVSAGRVLFLDYDGTLVSFARRPSLARPTPELLAVLDALAADSATTVVIISGRDRNTLEQWFGHMRLGLVAEHGSWVRDLQQDWKLTKQLTNDWKVSLRPILELYADRLPGSMVEEKQSSLVWHYRAADPEQGRMLARELTDHLVTYTANADIQVMRGHKVIEIRTAGVNKGTACEHFLADREFSFVLATGDDWTDEDMFNVMPPDAFSIKVGIANTRARYNVRSPRDVVELLHEFAEAGASRHVRKSDIGV